MRKHVDKPSHFYKQTYRDIQLRSNRHDYWKYSPIDNMKQITFHTKTEHIANREHAPGSRQKSQTKVIINVDHALKSILPTMYSRSCITNGDQKPVYTPTNQNFNHELVYKPTTQFINQSPHTHKSVHELVRTLLMLLMTRMCCESITHDVLKVCMWFESMTHDDPWCAGSMNVVCCESMTHDLLEVWMWCVVKVIMTHDVLRKYECYVLRKYDNDMLSVWLWYV